jgi:hypothetical protein
MKHSIYIYIYIYILRPFLTTDLLRSLWYVLIVLIFARRLQHKVGNMVKNINILSNLQLINAIAVTINIHLMLLRCECF